ncbi:MULTISPECIES: C69 family dipeptidase [Anaerolinea]|uniref:C69 family dipeptidase n=1 Tax=Anaerolinea TaxID=233189 RepID=UPI00260E6B97|nr:C69 family dipeptidase [Anaerolinea thermophila]
MCDTFVVLPERTGGWGTLLGKNSDREPNEAHQVVYIPAQDFPEGATVHCTYREIPQVRHTFAVLLMKPFWIWGAEMGVNEHGVAIGNEAVFTRIPYQKDARLTGMDLLRLALERSASAEEALNVIVELLEQYGQGGNCGLTHGFYYHNSYLIADPRSAWVLETAGEHWVAEKVQGIRTISNALTIGETWDRISPQAISFARQQGWLPQGKAFSFSGVYSDFLYTTFGAGRFRQSCTTRLLLESQQPVDVHRAFQVLRAHGTGENEENWRPDVAVHGADVCMHAGWGPIRVSQTTGSAVFELREDGVRVWVTATAAPCTSIYKPLWMDTSIPWQSEPEPTAVYNPACLWWRHERLHRQTLENYPQRIQLYRAERDALEARFLQGIPAMQASVAERSRYAQTCFEMAEQAEAHWLELIRGAGRENRRFYTRWAWKKFNQQAKMPA